MKPLNLLIDAGNRRVKWALAPGGGAPAEIAGCPGGAFVWERGLAALRPPARPDAVWVSCVARAGRVRALEDHAREAWSLRPVFIAAAARQAGVVNRYAPPDALGSDRWAALLAARHLYPRQSVIVVDAGTAVTVDALDTGGNFLGGVIFPGVRTMRAGLNSHTDIALDDDGYDDSDAPVTATATATNEAVRSGALLAVAGGIAQVIARQRQALTVAGRDCRVVATGGDAARVVPLLTAAGLTLDVAPDLVLQGLALIAEARA